MKRRLTIALACLLPLAACCSCSSNTASSQSSQGSAAETPQKTYTVTRIEQPPNWDDIPQIDIDNVQWTDDYGIRAHAQLCYDDKALYVRMWAEEQDVRATYAADDPLPKCYEDSCLEMFLTPVADDPRYMNFEFNPNGALCCEIGTQKQGRVMLVPDYATLAVSPALTDDGWEITYQVPFAFMQTLYPDFQVEQGLQIRGNFYKCGNLTAHRHYLSWSPVASDTPNFHVPDSFGALVFG